MPAVSPLYSSSQHLISYQQSTHTHSSIIPTTTSTTIQPGQSPKNPQTSREQKSMYTKNRYSWKCTHVAWSEHWCKDKNKPKHEMEDEEDTVNTLCMPCMQKSFWGSRGAASRGILAGKFRSGTGKAWSCERGREGD